MAARTRSSATSWPRRSWASDPATPALQGGHHGFRPERRPAPAQGQRRPADRRQVRLRAAARLHDGAGRLEPGHVGAVRRARPARPAVQRGAWRLRRRPGGDHDRGGGVRARPGAGAVLRHRGAGRRADPARGRAGDAGRAAAADRRGRAAAGLRPCRAAVPLRAAQRVHHRAQRGRALAAGGREGRRAARRRGRQAAGHRAHRRRHAGPVGHRPVPGGRAERGCLGPRLSDAGRLARRRGLAGRRDGRPLGDPRARCRMWSAWWTRRSPSSRPRRSA